MPWGQRQGKEAPRSNLTSCFGRSSPAEAPCEDEESRSERGVEEAAVEVVCWRWREGPSRHEGSS